MLAADLLWTTLETTGDHSINTRGRQRTQKVQRYMPPVLHRFNGAQKAASWPYVADVESPDQNRNESCGKPQTETFVFPMPPHVANATVVSQVTAINNAES